MWGASQLITEEDKERVCAASDLVSIVSETVELRPRSGGEFWGCCPFHGEKTASFHVRPQNQTWFCFGCNSGGDVIDYIKRREGLNYPEAVHYLADRAGIEISDDRRAANKGTKRHRIFDVCEETAKYYHMLLMRGKDGRGRDYFKSRGFGAPVCNRYELGFAPGRSALVNHLSSLGFTPKELIDANVAVSRGSGRISDRFYDRVMFPIFDEQGHHIAFGGRIMGEGQPKYLNTSETSVFHKKRNLYGFNWAKESIVAEQCAIVVEGYTDCIACWEAGIKNVVATLGTALTEHHVKTLTRFVNKIIYLFDGDNAGQKAAERAIQFIESDSMDLRCVVLPDGQDPMEFVTAQGGDALRARLATAEPLMDFVFRKLEEKSDISTPGGRAKALEDMLKLIYPLRDSYLIDTYYVQISDRLGLDSAAVRESARHVFVEVGRSQAAARKREEAYNRSRARDSSQQANSAQAPTWQTTSASVSGAAPTRSPASLAPSDEAVPLDAYDAVPIDTVDDAPEPAGFDGRPQTASVPVILTDLERQALASERELLSLLTMFPDSFRAFDDRICSIDWVDKRSETIAFAVLATPEGTDSKNVMAAVRSVCPEASELVATGRISSTSKHPTETNIRFLLDTLEFFTVKRRMNATIGKLRVSTDLTDDERRDLVMQQQEDAKRSRELASAIEGVADPFRDEDAASTDGQTT